MNRLRVLLVEDSPSDAAIVRETLTDIPSIVLEDVPTLREAGNRLRQAEMDVVLLDLGLPDSHGLDTLQSLREQHPQMPIVVLTGLRDGAAGLAAVQQGAEDYLSKDQMNAVMLDRTLRYAVERKRLENALLASERNYSHRLEEQVAERTALAEQRAAQLRELANALAQSEQRERQRIARFLHDDFQQILVGAGMVLSRLLSAGTEEHRRAAGEHLQQLLQEAIAKSRSLTAQLSPPVLFDAGLPLALEWLSRRFRLDHELNIHLRVASELNILPPELATVIFESIRELLFNVVKHSKADEVTVVVEKCPGDQLKVVVSDRGIGFDPQRLEALDLGRHFGLANLKHRIGLVGGRLTVDSAPDRGCTACMVLPLASLAGGKKVLPADWKQV